MRKPILVIALILTTTVAAAFPTKVKLLRDADLASTEGQEIRLSTDKGTLAFSADNQAIYQAFAHKGKKGSCFKLETNSETLTEFNKKVDESGATDAVKVNCK